MTPGLPTGSQSRAKTVRLYFVYVRSCRQVQFFCTAVFKFLRGWPTLGAAQAGLDSKTRQTASQSGNRNTVKLSIIMPVLNEQKQLQQQLASLQDLRARGHELIVVDGGSKDNSRELAAPLVDQLLESQPGRARQMNTGATGADGDWLLFLHCDTRLPQQAGFSLEAALADTEAAWGWFDVRLSNPAMPYRLIAWFMNRRARLTRVCTGDQCLFVQRSLFRELGGFPELPLMEDVAMSKLLRRRARHRVFAGPVLTSSRRWEERGIVATVLLMWRLRLMYFFGVAPEKLRRRYYPEH